MLQDTIQGLYWGRYFESPQDDAPSQQHWRLQILGQNIPGCRHFITAWDYGGSNVGFDGRLQLIGMQGNGRIPRKLVPAVPPNP